MVVGNWITRQWVVNCGDRLLIFIINWNIQYCTAYVCLHLFHIVLVLCRRGSCSLSMPSLTISPNTIDMRNKQTVTFSCHVGDFLMYSELALSRQNQNHKTTIVCQLTWGYPIIFNTSDNCNKYHYKVCHTGRLIRLSNFLTPLVLFRVFMLII